MLQTNTRIPDFSLPDSHGITVSPSEHRGVYFAQVIQAKKDSPARGPQSVRIMQ